MARLRIVIEDTDRDHAELRRLIRFALSEIDTSDTFVLVRGTGFHGFAGELSYHDFSNDWRKRARPARFGIQVRVPTGGQGSRTYHGRYRRPKLVRNRETGKVEYREVKSGTPDNPGRWPVIETTTWQEAFVALVAHEGKHVEFARERLPQSEVRCEFFSQKMLKKFKEVQA